MKIEIPQSQKAINPAGLNVTSDGLPTMEQILYESGFEKNSTLSWGNFCPFCGGTKRLHVFQNDTGEWHFICNVCGYHGDGVRYLMEQEGFSFQNACVICGCPEKIKYGYKGNATWTPKIKLPAIRYGESRPADFSQEMARELVIYACGNLDDPQCREYLSKCHIRRSTAERFFFGWMPRTFYRSREKWGLPKKDGNKDALYLPKGFTMPVINPMPIQETSHIFQIEWRCLEKDIQRKAGDPEHVYATHHILTGSGYSYWSSGMNTEKPVFVTEGIKDAVLLWQYGNGQIETMATLGCGKLPTKEIVDYLRKCPSVILCYDADDAGRKAVKNWTQYKLENLHSVFVPDVHFPNGKRIKDVCEYIDVGGNCEYWIKGVLADIQEIREQAEIVQQAVNPAGQDNVTADISAMQESERTENKRGARENQENQVALKKESAENADLKKELHSIDNTANNAHSLPQNENIINNIPAIFPLEFDAVLTAGETEIGEWQAECRGLDKPLNNFNLPDYGAICRRYSTVDGCTACKYYRVTMPVLCGLYAKVFCDE